METEKDETRPSPDADPERGDTSNEDTGTTVEEESEQSFPASDPPSY